MSLSNIEKAKSSRTFCILPWIHQYIGPPGDVKPCCLYEQDMQLGSLKDNTLEEVWNNDETKKLRLEMLNGVESAGCAKCNTRENLTRTHRDNFNETFFNESLHGLVNNTNDDGSLNAHRLLYIDARFNNLCNFKCRTCGPRFSTSWADDQAAIGGIAPQDRKAHQLTLTFPGKKPEQLLSELMPHLGYVKHIYFAGGEPLMQEDHYLVLQELIRLKRNTQINTVWIDYNSNFSTLKLGKWNIIDMWRHFHHDKWSQIKFNASIDGSHARAEYWRKGTDWAEIVENRRKLKAELPNVKFTVNYTLSWVNAFNLPEFHREWVDQGLLEVDNLSVNLLDVPSFYSIKAMPTWKKKQIEQVLLEHIDWLVTKLASKRVIDDYKNAITFMYDSEPSDKFVLLKEFEDRNDFIDKLRGEDFLSVFPEHKDLFDV